MLCAISLPISVGMYFFAWRHFGEMSPRISMEDFILNRRPNFVVIFLDDSGWADFRPFGETGETAYPTPNVEKLAAGGMLLPPVLRASGDLFCVAGVLVDGVLSGQA